MGARTAVIFTSSSATTTGLALTVRQPPGTDLPVASSVANFPDGEWVALRVATQADAVSVSTASLPSPYSEVLRWSGPQGSAGQLGLVLVGIALGTTPIRAEFRNLRVHTLATIPDGGATQAAWSFMGTNALAGIRQSAGGAVLASCPAYDAGCADCMPTSAGCLQLDGTNSSAFASFDVPVGIDEAQPWTLKFKFAAAAGMLVNSPAILRTNIAPILPNCCNTFSGQPLLDVNGGFSWANPLRAWVGHRDAGRVPSPPACGTPSSCGSTHSWAPIPSSGTTRSAATAATPACWGRTWERSHSAARTTCMRKVTFLYRM